MWCGREREVDPLNQRVYIAVLLELYKRLCLTNQNLFTLKWTMNKTISLLPSQSSSLSSHRVTLLILILNSKWSCKIILLISILQSKSIYKIILRMEEPQKTDNSHHVNSCQKPFYSVEFKNFYEFWVVMVVC